MAIEYTDYISPAKGYPEYDTKLDLMVRLYSGDLGSMEYPFIAITPNSTLACSSSCKEPIYRSNRSV